LQAVGGSFSDRARQGPRNCVGIGWRCGLGFDFEGIVGVVKALTAGDFYKSMTTHADHRIWQDVYRPTTPNGEVYLKLTVIDDALIVSFKEL